MRARLRPLRKVRTARRRNLRTDHPYGEDSNATGGDGAQGDEGTGGSGAAYVFVRNGATAPEQTATP